MDAYTDYPLVGLGDVAGEKAPIRKVVPISYDGDKYVDVVFEGRQFQFKAGYLYSMIGRCGEVPTFPVETLPVA